MERGRGYGGGAGLTRAQFPPGGTRCPRDLRWSRAVARPPGEEEEDEKEEEEEEGQGAPGRGLSRARWRCGGGRGT